MNSVEPWTDEDEQIFQSLVADREQWKAKDLRRPIGTPMPEYIDRQAAKTLHLEVSWTTRLNIWVIENLIVKALDEQNNITLDELAKRFGLRAHARDGHTSAADILYELIEDMKK